MLEPVAHHEIAGAQHGVVTLDLREDLLGDSDGGRFVFCYHQWRAVNGGIDDGVATASSAADCQTDLVANQCRGVVEMVDEVGYEVLPHPFLSGKGDEATALGIENLWAVVRP